MSCFLEVAAAAVGADAAFFGFEVEVVDFLAFLVGEEALDVVVDDAGALRLLGEVGEVGLLAVGGSRRGEEAVGEEGGCEAALVGEAGCDC